MAPAVTITHKPRTGDVERPKIDRRNAILMMTFGSFRKYTVSYDFKRGKRHGVEAKVLDLNAYMGV